MSDLISKFELLKILNEKRMKLIPSIDGGHSISIETIIDFVADFPTEKTEPQWIPCSERLPKCNGCYLVWRPHFFGGEIGMPAICYFDGQDTWHDSYGVDFTRILNAKDVIAWMPLPEPYKGE